MKLTASGWVEPAQHALSPNHNARSIDEVVSLLVVHCISLPPGHYGTEAVTDFFQNQLDTSQHPYFQTIVDLQVSAHFLIARDGALTQFVSVHDRAWHAGQSCFQGREACNDYSIGIELEGTEVDAFEINQYQTLSCLTRLLQQHFPAITSERIVGHSDIAPGRKTDPGSGFDWAQYRALLGHE